MARMMRSVRLLRVGAPLEEQLLPVPVPGPGEVLIRIEAAGVCHSDAHYRTGVASPPSLPVTLGHEIAGVVDATGERVCLHYMKSCRVCEACSEGAEQFCRDASMIGKSCDGGFAEYVSVPEFNVVRIPADVSFEAAAIMMCSTATAFHAIRKARFKPTERAAVFGVGGLGLSAVQLLRELGAREVFAVDIDEARLERAARYGAVPVDASRADPVEEIVGRAGGEGVHVALELLGKPVTIEQSLRVLRRGGRAAIAGIAEETVSIDTYRLLIGRERELIGVSDHLRRELPVLLDLAAAGRLDFEGVITEHLPLDAPAINGVLDRLAVYGAGVRAVVRPRESGSPP